VGFVSRLGGSNTRKFTGSDAKLQTLLAKAV
jgi:ribosomal protein S18